MTTASETQIIHHHLTGSNKDYIVIGSDSGKISIVEYDAALNDWKPIHCEIFGKSGCRRIVPGQYLAADPKGRALIVGIWRLIFHLFNTISMVVTHSSYLYSLMQLELKSKNLCM